MSPLEQVRLGKEALLKAGFRANRLRVCMPKGALEKIAVGLFTFAQPADDVLPGQIGKLYGMPVFSGPEIKVQAMEDGLPLNHGLSPVPE